MLYKGSCHCGQIAFEVEGKIQCVIECNCSICTKRDHLLWFVPRTQLNLLTPDDNLSTYLFNTKKSNTVFVLPVDAAPFRERTDPKSGMVMAAVNVRCLEDIEFSKLKMMPFDGRSL